jgi:hypothetical protein
MRFRGNYHLVVVRSGIIFFDHSGRLIFFSWMQLQKSDDCGLCLIPMLSYYPIPG